MVLTARRCVSWSSHADCGALSGGESELSLSVATHEGFREWTTVPARGQCRETLGDLQGIVRKKTRVPQRTNEPSSEKIVHDGARLARIKPRRRCHAAPRPVRQCSGVGGRFFCRWRHQPRLQCFPRYLWPTRHNCRHSDEPPPLAAAAVEKNCPFLRMLLFVGACVVSPISRKKRRKKYPPPPRWPAGLLVPAGAF